MLYIFIIFKSTMTDSKPILNERAVRHNAAVIEYCRTSLAVIAGITAGVLGLTGLYGFVFYFVYSIIISGLLAVKVGPHWNTYFKTRRVIWTDGIIGGLFTYVLLWTFIYGIVHVF